MNTTRLTTILGLVQAVGAGLLDYLMHTPMDGGAIKQPTFWVGLVVAAAMGVKGFYTQGIHQPQLQPQTAKIEEPKA